MCIVDFSLFLLPFVASNLLFVESPAGVGWSYSNTTSDYNANDDSTGEKITQINQSNHRNEQTFHLLVVYYYEDETRQ